MSQQTIYYFDNNATTRVAPEVVDAMIPFLREQWGNPSSTYDFGRQVGGHVDKARARVAALINAEPREIVFTSCGTESDNSAIHSALVTQPEKRHVLTTAVEHSANLKFCEYLVKRGYTVTYLPVTPDGEHGNRIRDVGEQRDGCPVPGARTGGDLPTERGAVPHRRGADAGQAED
jgi:cysteine desulfurase